MKKIWDKRPSLNVGLRYARGAYIARMDAGDIAFPKRLQKQFSYLEEHSDVDILGTAVFAYDMSGNYCRSVFMPNRPSTILQRIFFACPVGHISVMMRRKRIMQLVAITNRTEYSQIMVFGQRHCKTDSGSGIWEKFCPISCYS
jgi:glycosyltransferase involved in cell wall biosynthesis